MADDSVPLPYPNLKVPTWYYQVQHVDYKKDEAEKAFWEAVEKDGMSHVDWTSSCLHEQPADDLNFYA